MVDNIPTNISGINTDSNNSYRSSLLNSGCSNTSNTPINDLKIKRRERIFLSIDNKINASLSSNRNKTTRPSQKSLFPQQIAEYTSLDGNQNAVSSPRTIENNNSTNSTEATNSLSSSSLSSQTKNKSEPSHTPDLASSEKSVRNSDNGNFFSFGKQNSNYFEGDELGCVADVNVNLDLSPSISCPPRRTKAAQLRARMREQEQRLRSNKILKNVDIQGNYEMSNSGIQTSLNMDDTHTVSSETSPLNQSDERINPLVANETEFQSSSNNPMTKIERIRSRMREQERKFLTLVPLQRERSGSTFVPKELLHSSQHAQSKAEIIRSRMREQERRFSSMKERNHYTNENFLGHVSFMHQMKEIREILQQMSEEKVIMEQKLNRLQKRQDFLEYGQRKVYLHLDLEHYDCKDVDQMDVSNEFDRMQLQIDALAAMKEELLDIIRHKDTEINILESFVTGDLPQHNHLLEKSAKVNRIGLGSNYIKGIETSICNGTDDAENNKVVSQLGMQGQHQDKDVNKKSKTNDVSSRVPIRFYL